MRSDTITMEKEIRELEAQLAERKMLDGYNLTVERERRQFLIRNKALREALQRYREVYPRLGCAEESCRLCRLDDAARAALNTEQKAHP